MGNNNWNFERIIALIGLIATILALAVAVTTPEIRRCIGLEDKSAPQPEPASPVTSLPQPVPQPVHPPIKETKMVQPAAPEKPQPKPVTPEQPPVEKTTTQFSYILYENGPQFVETADAELSFSVTTINKESIVSLHIAPKGRKSSNHAVWTGDEVEFSSAVGDFLVHVLKVDLESGIIAVQVSRKWYLLSFRAEREILYVAGIPPFGRNDRLLSFYGASAITSRKNIRRCYEKQSAS